MSRIRGEEAGNSQWAVIGRLQLCTYNPFDVVGIVVDIGIVFVYKVYYLSARSGAR